MAESAGKNIGKPLKKLSIQAEYFISSLKIHISNLEMHISSLKMYISSLEMKLPSGIGRLYKPHQPVFRQEKGSFIGCHPQGVRK